MAQPTKQFQSPFLDVLSFPRQQSEILEEESNTLTPISSSPFTSLYQIEEGEEAIDPESEEFIQFLGELHDEEFNDAVFELVNEASILYEDRFANQYEDAPSQTMETEHFLQEHFSPLQNELENLLDFMADEVEKYDLETMTDAQIDTFVDSYQPTGELSPNFENLWGWAKKKLKKAAKKAAKWAKKKAKRLAARAFRSALKKIKRYFRPMLKKVLTFAIAKLPKKYQGMANLLRKKLGYEISEEITIEGELDTIGEIDQIQQEFDLFIANLLMTDDETKHELMLAEIVNESEQTTTTPLLTLDNARDQFIEEITNLKEGEDPAPIVENFLPAVMWAVKLGLKFYGRPKLVNYLAKYLARLIGRYVGRKNAVGLSRVLVSAGLRLVNLEATENDETQVAGEAIASMLEETLYEVASLPEYILDDETLLEGFILEAFEKAATRNLPEILPEETYVKRPNLRESKGLKGAWIRKLKRRKRFYKKYSRVLKTKLSYHKLRAIKSFAGTPLSEILQNQYGLAPDANLEAMVHLYEATPGTTLPQISQYEDNISGLKQGKYAYTQLHPLTPEVAGMLFSEPGLGRSVPKTYLNNRRRICVGQRFYYLEIPGAQLQMMPAYDSTSAPVLKHSNSVKLTLDFSKQQIRFYLFLSESNAQNLTVKLRQKLPLGGVLVVLRSMMKSRLKNILSTEISGQLKIIHEAIPPKQTNNSLLGLPQSVKSNLEMRLLDWLGKGLIQYFQQQSQEFIIATEAPADGVTIKMCLDNPPSFDLLRKILKGSAVSTRNVDFSGHISKTVVKSIPGYHSE